MTTRISSRRHRTALRALVAAALLAVTLAVALAAGAGSANAAASACGMKVIDDWYDNGRVDGSYPLRCYDDAIDALPRDVLDYSSAKGDITRALQARMNGQPTPAATNDPTPGDPGTVTGPGAEPEPGTETGEEETETNGGPNKDGDDGGVPEAGAGDVDTASSDSVPVPLLVLAGLALLLVAAGSVGYLTRRLQARRLPPPS